MSELYYGGGWGISGAIIAFVIFIILIIIAIAIFA